MVVRRNIWIHMLSTDKPLVVKNSSHHIIRSHRNNNNNNNNSHQLLLFSSSDSSRDIPTPSNNHHHKCINSLLNPTVSVEHNTSIRPHNSTVISAQISSSKSNPNTRQRTKPVPWPPIPTAPSTEKLPRSIACNNHHHKTRRLTRSLMLVTTTTMTSKTTTTRRRREWRITRR